MQTLSGVPWHGNVRNFGLIGQPPVFSAEGGGVFSRNRPQKLVGDA
jgi:hypothetical protein